MNDEKKDELQSRRQFFKKAAKATLPILGAIALANMPIVASASETAMGCRNTCSRSCTDTCTNTCISRCKAGCSGCGTACFQGCAQGCIHSCTGCKGR
jgi:CXXX repeat radical SAM target protein